MLCCVVLLFGVGLICCELLCFSLFCLMCVFGCQVCLFCFDWLHFVLIRCSCSCVGALYCGVVFVQLV